MATWGSYSYQLPRLRPLPYEQIIADVEREQALGPRLTIQCVAGMHERTCIMSNPAASCVCHCHVVARARARRTLEAARQAFRNAPCWLCGSGIGCNGKRES